MSNNKSKYFEVTTTSVIRANNMADARRAAVSRTRVPGTEVLARSTDTTRIYADDARILVENLSDS